MRDINSTVLAELAKTQLRPFYILDIVIDSTHYRYTNCDVPIVYDGNIYSPRGFDFNTISYSAGTIVARASIEIDNLDEIMTALFVGNTVQGSAVTLKAVVLDNDWHIIGQPWGLVAAYDFDEGSGGILTDRTGNGNNGVIGGSTTWVDGISGQALNFTASSSDKVTISSFSALPTSAITVCCWIYISAMESLHNYIHHTWANPGAWMLYSTPTSVYFALMTGDGLKGVSAIIDISGSWYFLCGTYDQSDLKIYIDGELINTNNVGSYTLDSTGDVIISDDAFAKKVDEARIYNRALSQAEITYLFNNPGNDMSAGAITIFQGEIDAWQLDEQRLSMEVTSILTRWSQKTIMRHPSSCRWKKFKGDECGYSGAATWCDRTYTRCVALGNTANFGGNRWLPAIMDKELWWGRTQK